MICRRPAAEGSDGLLENGKKSRSFYVARGAIWHLVKLMKLNPDDTVLMPSYHCGVEVAAVQDAGAQVEYYQIRRTMQADLLDIERRITKNTKALFVIYYFGFPQPMHQIVELCRKHRLILIEDCAHVLVGWYQGKRLGEFGDYAVFSLQKCLPVPDGGVLRTSGSADLSSISLVAPPLLPLLRQAAILLMNRLRISSAGLHSVVDRFIFRLIRVGLNVVRGHARTNTIATLNPSAGAFVPEVVRFAMSSLSKWILGNISIQEVIEKRRANYSYLLKKLGEVDGFSPCFGELDDGTCPMFFPIFVRERDQVQQSLTERGIATFIFGRTLNTQLSKEEYADAYYLSNSNLGLPVHQDLGASELDYMCDVLRICLSV